MAHPSFSRSRSQLRLAWLTSAALLLPAAVQAQQPATLTGKVTSDAGQPLASAGIIIEQLGAGAVTRPDGSYTILIPGARVPSGPVTVTARLVGYKARSAQVDFSSGSAVQDFSLPDNPLQLGELVVTGAGTVSEVESWGPARAPGNRLPLGRARDPTGSTRLPAKRLKSTTPPTPGTPGHRRGTLTRGRPPFT